MKVPVTISTCKIAVQVCAATDWRDLPKLLENCRREIIPPYRAELETYIAEKVEPFLAKMQAKG